MATLAVLIIIIIMLIKINLYFSCKQEEVDEPPPETRIELEIPRICTNLGREVHFVKLPNFLSVDTRY